MILVFSTQHEAQQCLLAYIRAFRQATLKRVQTDAGEEFHVQSAYGE